MPQQITIELSDAQYKAMSIIAYSPTDWVQNAAQVRANKAINEIADREIARMLEEGQAVSGTKEDIVIAANIPTAKEVSDQAEVDLP